MTWFLENVEHRAKKYPTTFQIPSREERTALPLGTFVKLVFIGARGSDGAATGRGERMWVEIVEIKDGHYRGILRNDPVVIRDLHIGALVDFGPEHIADC